MFEKTNPTATTGWTTWTFDPLPATEPELAPAAPSLPTPLDFVMVILPTIRRFPEAYQALREAMRRHWPFLFTHAPPAGNQVEPNQTG
jgi:hypothetical protein